MWILELGRGRSICSTPPGVSRRLDDPAPTPAQSTTTTSSREARIDEEGEGVREGSHTPYLSKERGALRALDHYGRAAP